MRATWRPAAARVPPGRTKLLSSGKLGVEPVAVLLEPSTCACSTRSRPSTLAGHGEVGTEVEELVLDALERPVGARPGTSPARTTPSAALSSSTVPNASIRGSSFDDARPVAERRLPRVAAARVDPRQAHRLVLARGMRRAYPAVRRRRSAAWPERGADREPAVGSARSSRAITIRWISLVPS